MSYYLEAVKDAPMTLFMLDGTTLDSSGKGTVLGAAGSGFINGVPLVNGQNQSFGYTPAGYTAFNFPYGRPGTEKQPFTLEAWFIPNDNISYLLSHSGDYVGLSYYLDTVTFTQSFVGQPLAVVSKVVQRKSLIHAVAVYTGSSMSLYVNGTLVDSYEFTEEQKAAAFSLAVDNQFLYQGLANITVQALTTYNYALNKDQVSNHYKAGMENSGSQQAASMFGGRYFDLSQATADIFAAKEWSGDNFMTSGYGNAKRDNYGVSNAVDPVTGAAVVSTWEDIFELESGGTSIDGVQIDWDGNGSHWVQTSLDGINWTTQTNGKRIASLGPNFNPTGQTLRVRVAFLSGSGKVTRLKLTGLKSVAVKGHEKIPVTLPTGTTFGPSNEMNKYDFYTGAEFTGTLSIGPNAEDDAVGFRSLSFWYLASSGTTLSTDMPGTFYENYGVSTTINTKIGQWTFVTIANASLDTTSINITSTGGPIRIAYPTLYEDQLTQAQIRQVFNAFTGNQRIVGTSTDVATAITEGDASVYAANWSIQPAG